MTDDLRIGQRVFDSLCKMTSLEFQIGHATNLEEALKIFRLYHHATMSALDALNDAMQAASAVLLTHSLTMN